MDNLATTNKVSYVPYSDGYTSLVQAGTELGFYKQLQHSVVAYRHFQNGREFKTFNSVYEAEGWILKNRTRPQ